MASRDRREALTSDRTAVRGRCWSLWAALRRPTDGPRKYYVTLPPISPTIAPKPIMYVVEHASEAAFTSSERPPNAASSTFKISARTVSTATVEKISLKRGIRSDSY